MNATIRQASESDAALVAGIISRAFAEVALRFSLTRENCPKHPSNCTADWVRQDRKRGVRYFVAQDKAVPLGCVAMEMGSPGTCYLERLAVLPEQRKRGIGRALVEHVVQSARAAAAHRVSIGIIASHVELREWYRRLGFQDRATKSFPHLPFEVLFMEMEFDTAAGQ